MAVVGEASVRIVGNLKPLSDSLAQAKKMTKDFDAAINSSMKKTSSLLKNISNVKPKVDFSSVVKMNQSFDNAIRRIDTINKKAIKPKTELPSAGFFKGFSDSAEFANTSVNKLDQSLKRIASVTAGYLGVRELQRYADAWTSIGNQLAAASQISGMQARSLQDLNKLANESRSGIEETANLYARLMRSTAGVAKSEEEIAKATDAVNKAFKAGGAAASEQAAGIMQLGQALGSGFLQGDELRSIRENAPLVAQAIADEFKTTIAGLKDLGAEGKLTSDRVFKALLNSHEGINKTFATTNATIADGFTRLNNAVTEYIGMADKANGATLSINGLLNYLADNFASAADMALKFAAAIAGLIVGRSLASMATALSMASVDLIKFVNSLRLASTVAGTSAIAFGSLASAAIPLVGVIGAIASVAAFSYVTSINESGESTERFKKEMEDLGIISKETAKEIENSAEKIKELSEADQARKLASIKEEIDNIRNGFALFGSENNLAVVLNQATNASKNLFNSFKDKQAYTNIADIVRGIKDMSLSSEQARDKLEAIKNTDVSQPVVDLIEKVLTLNKYLGGLETYQARFVDKEAITEAEASIDTLVASLDRIAQHTDLTEATREEISALVESAKDGELSAEDLNKEIMRLQTANPNISGLLGTLQTLVTNLFNVRQEAERAAQAVKLAAMADRDYKSNDIIDVSGRRKVQDAKDYVEEQKKQYSETTKELSARKALEAVQKQAIKDGKTLTKEQEQQLVNARLAGEQARKQDTKKPKREKQEKQEKLNEYQKELRSIEETIAAMQAEQAVLEAVNPALNDYGFAMAKAEKAQELLSMAKRAGIEVSKEQLTLEQLLAGEFGHLTGKAREQAEAIYFAADSFAAATANGEVLKEKNQEIADSYNTIKEASRSALSGFVSDMAKGKSAAEALSNALGKLADALLKVGLDILFGSSGSGGFGAIGKLFGFASGGYTGDGGKYEPAGVVHKGEYVFSKAATQRLGVGNLEAMHSKAKKGYANGVLVSGISVPNSNLSSRAGSLSSGSSNSGGGETYAPVYNFSGTSEEFNKFKQFVLERDKQFNARAVNAVQKGAKKNVGF